jgi:hypothetical protein
MTRAISLQERIDALRRKCSTGYGCGAACISLRKECRTSPSSSIGKQRLKRLLEIAAGGASKQRGIAPVKPKEAGEMAGAITVQRGEKAGQLRGVRQQAAAEKAEAAEAAAKAAAQVRQPRPSNSAPGNSAGGTPRAKAETVEGSGDYEFARKSAIQNAGEDIALSARHKRNAFRTIEEAEASGQVEKLLTRDNLLKNFPTDLVSGVAPENVLGRLEAHYCLKAFPNLPAKEIEAYIRGVERREKNRENLERSTGRKQEPEQAVDAKTVRRQYFEAFQTIRQFVDDNKDVEPGALRNKLKDKVAELINTYRKTEGRDYAQFHRDPFNPAGNALIAMYNRLRIGGKASVYGQLNEFSKALSSTGGIDKNDARGTLERMVEPATRIIEGASLNEAFGQKGANGKWRFTAADRYVGQANREGGRQVGGTPQAATDTIVKDLGFRGLQYGNSVTDDERKHHVQKAAEALVDLADALDLPDKAIGLNGTLGLAIGARGRGGAVAHYETELKVINLTRKNGVGSLSHEWGHALDNFAASRDATGPHWGGFLTEQYGPPEQREAMKMVVRAWTTSGYVDQCFSTIRDIKKAGGMISDSYWMSHVELFARSFEAHVSLKLARAGRSNTYLTRELHDGGMKKGGKDLNVGDGLWPTRQQAEAMEPAFDALIARIRQDNFPGSANRRDSREQRIRHMIQSLTTPGNHSTQSSHDRGDEMGLHWMSKGEPMHSSQTLQMRIDALQRKCSTGYGCGAACISLRKVCRTSPSSTIGKVRLNRLLELAAVGGSNQKGINQVKPKEAAELAEGISAQRGERAAQLRNARQQTKATTSNQEAAAGQKPAVAPKPSAERALPQKGGALALRQQPQEQRRSGPATPDEKYAGKADDASVTAYAKEKAKQLLNNPQAWENSAFVRNQTKDDNFSHAVINGDDTKALRAFSSYLNGMRKTREAELKRGHSFSTDKPEEIEKKLEKAKVSKSKNKEKTVASLTKKLAEAKQQLEDARVFVEETYPRMKAMSDEEKIAYARNRAQKNVDRVIQFGIRDLKSESRGGNEVAAVADFLRVEQGGMRKGVAELLGEDSADDMEVIRAQLTGKGTSEGALGLKPGVQPTRSELKSAYRKAAAKSHPDAGGSPEEFRMTQQAYERLKKKYKYDSLMARLDALRARCC